MKLVVNVPDDDIVLLDRIVLQTRGQYYKRSDCVRDLIRDYVVKHGGEVKAVVAPPVAATAAIDFTPAAMPPVLKKCFMCRRGFCDACSSGETRAVCECECKGLKVGRGVDKLGNLMGEPRMHGTPGLPCLHASHGDPKGCKNDRCVKWVCDVCRSGAGVRGIPCLNVDDPDMWNQGNRCARFAAAKEAPKEHVAFICPDCRNDLHDDCWHGRPNPLLRVNPDAEPEINCECETCMESRA